jgi:hypothetical protein
MSLPSLLAFSRALAAAAFLLGAASVPRAETMVARDTTNAYQKSPHHKLRHVLLYDWSVSHTLGRAAVRASLARTAVRYGFRLDTSSAPIGYITPAVLQGVDVVVFGHNSRDVLDSTPSLAAMEDFLYQRGKALLMIHEAAAFISCPGRGTGGGGDSLAHPQCRLLARAAVRQYRYSANPGTLMRVYVDSTSEGSVPPYTPASGSSFAVPPPAAASHGIRNPETRNIFTGLPRSVDSLPDEWYTYVSSPRLVGDMNRVISSLESRIYVEGRVNVLLSIDEGSYPLPSDLRMGDHPVAWTRKMGNGLAAVNVMGHQDPYGARDSLLERFNGRLLRYLARDFVGCTNPAFLEYNPEASVTALTASDDPNPCKTVVSLRSGGSAPDAGISTRGTKIHITLAEPGEHVLRVLEVSGKQALARHVRGQGTPVQISGLKPGIYFVRVTAPSGAKTAARVSLF